MLLIFYLFLFYFIFFYHEQPLCDTKHVPRTVTSRVFRNSRDSCHATERNPDLPFHFFTYDFVISEWMNGRGKSARQSLLRTHKSDRIFICYGDVFWNGGKNG